MELRHLRYFVAVAEEGSLTGAARRLFVAQPALSRQIRDLEREIGVPLLHRHSRGVRPTRAGEAFLSEARRTLEGAARAVDSARAAARQREGVLRFAHGELFAFRAPVERLLASFGAAHPGVPVRVHGQSDLSTWESLRDGTIDVGCVFLGRWPPDGIEGHVIADVSATGVLLPASHPLAARPTVALAELATLPWLGVTNARWPGFREDVVRALRARGLDPTGGAESPTASSVLRIAAGEVWALANEEMRAVYERAAAVVYRPFREPSIPMWLALVWMDPPAARVEELVAIARGMGGEPAGPSARVDAG